jgi:2-polyprenyl-6-methoxyphenol hydroxylase-like FAD-dependent oxidoreductase
LLARAGWKTVVVESKVFPRRKVCGEYLSATNMPLFRELGLADQFSEIAGPPVTDTAIFVGASSAVSKLPRLGPEPLALGRALSRERLDLLLLQQAAAAGASVLQPCRCVRLCADGAGHIARLEQDAAGELQLRAKAVIAAHGSWELGELPTQPHSAPKGPGDWLGFKAHFQGAALPQGLMPLLSFPAGYGGMVHCDGDRVSLSCCIQRHRLERLDRRAGVTAGEAVLQHILESTPILKPIFANATVADPWLSVGPIRPGFRGCYRDGVFLVGNAAGEAHPVVAEGISMAMQSAWLLVQELLPRQDDLLRAEVREQVAKRYSANWRRSFAARLRFASLVAHWAARPRMVLASLPILQRCPAVLTWGAGLSGKNSVVVN